MKRLFWWAVMPLVLAGGLYAGGVYIYQNRLYAPVSRLLSDETKQTLRDTVLVFQAKAALEREVADLERRLEQTEEVQELFEAMLRNNPNLPEDLPFHKVSDQILQTDRDRFSIVSYETSFIPLSHWGRRAYVESYQGDLLLVTAMGTVGRVPLSEMTGDGFDIPVVRTNLRELIPNPEFYEINGFSIKDALVHENRLLISYTKLLRPGCYTLAIAAADITDENLVFSDIFVPGECVLEDNEGGRFDANQNGGRMLATGPDTLLLSTGEWLVWELAQDPDSLFGKVVEVDLNTSDYVIKSLGHRNPQGLYYDPEANIIVVSEHGPAGGDEVNINRSPDGAVKNYGWPVASYGVHYTETPEALARAPLYKSHAEHGFEEPDLQFTPSASPSEIVRLVDPRDPDRYALMLGTMGFDYREGDESLHILELDKDFRITARERIILDDRVRDMIHLPGTRQYVLYLEGDVYEFGTIALLSANP